MARGNDNQITVRAVLAYAKRLRDRAEAAKAADPGARPLYSPSKDTAYKLSAQLGPERALTELATRARARELVIEEEGARAAAARREHRLHHLIVRGEVDADLDALSWGTRLDRALFALGLVSDAPAGRPMDADRSSGGDGDGLPLRRAERERVLLEEDYKRVVLRAERMADKRRRRLVEEHAA